MNENAARLDWAGAGVRVPRRFLGPRTLRLAVERALERALDPGPGRRDRGVVGGRTTPAPRRLCSSRSLPPDRCASGHELAAACGRGPDRRCCIIGAVDDAVVRFLAATEANDMAGLASTLAPDVTLPSPLIGSAVFKGRDDVVGVLSVVYATIRDVHWEAPIGQGMQRLAVAEARVAGLRIGDAMVFEVGADGLITRVRPHLRPLLATFVLFLMIGPRVATNPGLLLRAVRP